MKLTTTERIAFSAAAAAIVGCSAILLSTFTATRTPSTASDHPGKVPTIDKTAKALTTEFPADAYSVVDSRKLFGNETAIAELPPGAEGDGGIVLPAPTPTAEGARVNARIVSPESDRVTVIGGVRIGDEDFAIVENFGVGETLQVPVGGTAFGYRVVRVEDRTAVLEREGQQFTLELGAYKPESRRRGPSWSSSTGVNTTFGTVTMGDLDKWRDEARNNVMVRTPFGMVNSNQIHEWQSEARRSGSVTTPNGTFSRETLDQWHEQAHQSEKSATAQTPHGPVPLEQINQWREQGMRSSGGPDRERGR